MAFLGDGLEHRGNQFGVGRQRNVFLGPGLDRAHRGLGVVGHAARHHRQIDMFVGQTLDQVGDVESHVDQRQQDPGAGAGTQHFEGGIDVVGLQHLGAAPDRD